jgi:hypothetical protein
MEVSGQPHALAASALRKKPPVPFEEEAGFQILTALLLW